MASRHGLYQWKEFLFTQDDGMLYDTSILITNKITVQNEALHINEKRNLVKNV